MSRYKNDTKGETENQTTTEKLVNSILGFFGTLILGWIVLKILGSSSKAPQFVFPSVNVNLLSTIATILFFVVLFVGLIYVNRKYGENIIRVFKFSLVILLIDLAILVIFFYISVATTPTSASSNHAGSTTSTPTATVTKAPLLQKETLKVFFSKGSSSDTTKETFQGKVTITITGTAQSSGVTIADAFYFFTPLSSPTHRTDFTLWINGKPADAFISRIPSYRSDHKYTFTMNVPRGTLTFGVGSGLAQDKSGYYTLTVQSG